jgi:hypothetical protein
LDSKCKIYKRIKKIEKEKEENKIKLEKGLGDPIQPNSASDPWPSPGNFELVSSLLFPF